jgi:hypothetical protein
VQEHSLWLDVLDPADIPPVQFLTEISRSHDMFGSIRVHRLPRSAHRRTGSSGPRIALWFDEDLPGHVSANVYAIWDERERLLGSVLQREIRDSPTCVLFRHEDLAAAPPRITVVLRPDVKPAEASRDVREIWGDVIEFADVEVESDRKVIDFMLRVGSALEQLAAKAP